jgi:hypothetical protein
MAEANVKMIRGKSSDSAGSGSSNGHVRSALSKIKAATDLGLSIVQAIAERHEGAV